MHGRYLVILTVDPYKYQFSYEEFFKLFCSYLSDNYCCLYGFDYFIEHVGYSSGGVLSASFWIPGDEFDSSDLFPWEYGFYHVYKAY